MIDKEYALPVTAQCRLLNLSRPGVYYVPVGASDRDRDRDRDLMDLIDRIHMDEPYLGTRGIRNALWDKGYILIPEK